jgi:hypothetical protein
MAILIFIAALVIIGLWLAASYNSLIVLKNQALNGWKQIEMSS